MTSPPDVQNVPDVWGLLEQARDWIQQQTEWQLAGSKTVHPMALRIDAALAQRDRFVLVPFAPQVPHECRSCRWLDSNGPLVPAGRPFCEQFRFCPPVEQYRHFGCHEWAATPKLEEKHE